MHENSKIMPALPTSLRNLTDNDLLLLDPVGIMERVDQYIMLDRVTPISQRR